LKSEPSGKSRKPNFKKVAFWKNPESQILKSQPSGKSRKPKFEKVALWKNPEDQILKSQPSGKFRKPKFDSFVIGELVSVLRHCSATKDAETSSA